MPNGAAHTVLVPPGAAPGARLRFKVKLLTTYYPLPTTYYLLPTTYYSLLTTFLLRFKVKRPAGTAPAAPKPA